MNFIRFLDTEKDSKKKSIPYDINSLKLPNNDFISDMYRGFDSIDNCLSIYEYQDEDEKNRIIVNYEFLIMAFKNVSLNLRYLEIKKSELESLNIKTDKTNITKYYDNLSPLRHHDMINLTSSKIIDFILYFNDSKYEKSVSRKDLKVLINNSFSNNLIDTNKIHPYLLLEYKTRL